jgi:hypothetical protein
MLKWTRNKTTKKEEGADARPTERLLQTTTSLSTDVETGYEKYGLTPPKGKRAVSEKEAHRRIMKDGGKLKKLFKKGNDMTRKKLIFLYGRGFMWDKTTVKKEERINHVLQMLGDKEVSDRFLQVLETDGDIDLMSRGGEAIYKKHVMALKRYFSLDESFGFLGNTKDAEFYFRFQKSGNCFVHAPCVLTSYLLQKRAERNQALYGLDFAPLDVSRYVRRSFSDEQLFDYVVKDVGGAAIEVLENIVQYVTGDSNQKCEAYTANKVRKEDAKWLKELLAEYGPGLISQFKVTKTFERATTLSKENEGRIGIICFDSPNDKGKFIPLEESQNNEQDEEDIETIISKHDSSSVSTCSKNLSHDGLSGTKDTTKVPETHGRSAIGFHAMILLGGRTEKANPNKKYLLLQNWWEDMPLVEISDDYFRQALGQVLFVPDDRLEDFEKVAGSEDELYPRCSSLLAESNNIDRAEGGVWSNPVLERSCSIASS